MLVSLFNSLSFCLFPFTFFLLLSLLRFRIRDRVTSWSHCHTSVTLDDTVTVTVTSHEIPKKDIEGSGKIISYSMCNIWRP